MGVAQRDSAPNSPRKARSRSQDARTSDQMGGILINAEPEGRESPKRGLSTSDQTGYNSDQMGSSSDQMRVLLANWGRERAGQAAAELGALDSRAECCHVRRRLGLA